MFMDINQIFNSISTNSLIILTVTVFLIAILIAIISSYEYVVITTSGVFGAILFIFICVITHSLKIFLLVVSILSISSIINVIYNYIDTYFKLKKSRSNITFRDLLLNVDTYKLVQNLYQKWKKQVEEDIELDEHINTFSNCDMDSEEIIKRMDKVVSEKAEKHIKENGAIIKEKLFNYIEKIKKLAKTPNKYDTKDYIFTYEFIYSELNSLIFINIKNHLVMCNDYKSNLFYLYTSIDKKILENYYSIDIVSEIIFKITEKLKYLHDDEKLRDN